MNIQYQPQNPVMKALVFVTGLMLAGIGLAVASVIALFAKARKEMKAS